RRSLQELADAKVEQLRLSIRRHEDVNRLDVAMHDQTLMSIVDGRAHLKEQTKPSGDGGQVLRTIFVQRLALDIFRDYAGHAIRREPGIQKPHYGRMIEGCEHLPLQLKTPLRRGPIVGVLENFDGYTFMKLMVVALSEIYQAHAAFAELADDPVRPNMRTDERVRNTRRGDANSAVRFERGGPADIANNHVLDIGGMRFE